MRLLVIGDLMLDEFIWGKVSRISPEAPVPVVQVTGESYYPGGAGNVARNAAEFTTHTMLMGIAGDDEAGRRLLRILASAGIETAGIQISSARPTAVKTRVIARNQQVVRVDRERPGPATEEETAAAREYFDRAIAQCDAIVIADYAKGFLSQALADHVVESAREHGKVLTVDPHPHTPVVWRGATAIKPNRIEAFLAAGLPYSDEDEPLREAGHRLREKWNAESLLITQGEQGMLLFERGAQPHHIPARAKDVFDVSGAGDTAITVLTLALAAGASPREAAEMANCASGIVVGKLGTATVNTEELLEAIGG